MKKRGRGSGNNTSPDPSNDEEVLCVYCRKTYAGRFWHKHRQPCEVCGSMVHATCEH